MPDAALPPVPLAAIDLGSNSFRLEIGHVLHGRYQRIDYSKHTVRLGAGLDADGRLTEEATQRGIACLRGFAQRIAGMPAAHVRAVATQTLREASNRDAFLERAREALGRPIEVISGREEARLIFAGVSRLQPSNVPRLVVDVGGRSTEMIVGRRHTPHAAESFGIGCVSLSMKYFGDGRFSAAGFRAAEIAAGAEFEEALATFAPSRWREALGSSGSVGAVANWLELCGVGDGTITPAGLRWCIEQCIAAGDVSRLAIPGSKDDRRAVIGGGLAILYTLAAQFEIDAMHHARGALRHGLIFDLEERRGAAPGQVQGDPREHTVAELQRRFSLDVEQAKRVRSLAIDLYRQIAPTADDEAIRELGWAAALHEIGMTVSHHDHHRHSAYLIAHFDAAGFSQSQQRRLAALALGQRGGLRKVEASLADDDFAWRLLCLRLAIVACHSRQPVEPDALRLQRQQRRATLSFAPGWSGRHPLALHLLATEADAWGKNGSLSLAVQA